MGDWPDESGAAKTHVPSVQPVGPSPGQGVVGESSPSCWPDDFDAQDGLESTWACVQQPPLNSGPQW